MSDPKPGDFMVTRGTSTQWRDQLMCYIIQWGTASNVNHAGVYVGNGQVVEARPGGAGYAPLSEYQGPNTEWSTLPATSTATSLTDQQRLDITHAAINLIGTPYGWLDLIAVALAQRRLGKRLDPTAPLDRHPWWVKRIAREDRLICSELVDVAYIRAGVQLFDDGRYQGCVSPADLERVIDAGHTL